MDGSNIQREDHDEKFIERHDDINPEGWTEEELSDEPTEEYADPTPPENDSIAIEAQIRLSSIQLATQYMAAMQSPNRDINTLVANAGKIYDYLMMTPNEEDTPPQTP